MLRENSYLHDEIKTRVDVCRSSQISSQSQTLAINTIQQNHNIVSPIFILSLQSLHMLRLYDS